MGSRQANPLAPLNLISDQALNEEEAVSVVEPLKQVHFLRSKVKGHLAESEKQAIIKKARADHGSLATHFRKLASDLQESFDRILELL